MKRLPAQSRITSMERVLFLRFKLPVAMLALVFGSVFSCGQGPMRSSFHPELPVLPQLWEEILGPPHWRIEWIDAGGNWAMWEGREGFPALTLNEEWTNPVLAWPFWPEKGLFPGIVRPAGALFPWDVYSESLVLGWKQGVDAVLWRELAENSWRQGEKGTPRVPWYFDWPRFRELMEDGDIPVEVRLDPWIVDWKEIAKKTVESGFDRRRIKAEPRIDVSISGLGSPWIGTSPFAEPLIAERGNLVFKAGDRPETWFSAQGQLRLHKEAWIFIPWN